MHENKEDAEWRAEFEKDGATTVRAWLNAFPEPKRQFAFRWLREQEATRKVRDRQMHFYARWTFWAAVAAVVVGVIGVVVTLGH